MQVGLDSNGTTTGLLTKIYNTCKFICENI
jgi:hypothetical protein